MKQARKVILATTKVPETCSIQSGVNLLLQAFRQEAAETVERDFPVLDLDTTDPSPFLLREGFAYRSLELPDGTRAILDLLIPGDITGLDTVVTRHRHQQIISTGHLAGHRLPSVRLRELLSDAAVNQAVLGLILEATGRIDRLAVSLGRLDAFERIGTMMLDIYDRLRRRKLIRRANFHLPLTQDEIANYLGLTLAHVNRTLRRMREDQVLVFDRGNVTLPDLPRLRRLVSRRLAASDSMQQPVTGSLAAD